MTGYSDSLVIDEATSFISNKVRTLRVKLLTNIIVDDVMIDLYSRNTKLGCASGINGVMTEHLKYALGINIITMIRSILNICLKYGIVPEHFRKGLLRPILKKNNSDTILPKNYRPVTISPTFSKLLKTIILSSTDHKFHGAQFGFIHGRGSQMAITLANDVIRYCKSKGSNVHVCSLEAEVAFDAIPRSILFWKVKI